MSDKSIEINTVSYTIDIETTTESSTNSVTVATESANNIDVSSGFISVANVDDISGLENYFINFLTTRLLPVSGLDKQFESATSTFNIGVSGIDVDQINNLTTSASQINFLDLSTGAGSAEANKALVLDSDTSVTGINFLSTTGNIEVGNDLNILGDLTVRGTTTTVHSSQVDIGDNVITVNTSGLSTGGFRVFDGAVYQSLLWVGSNNRWEFGNDADIHTSGIAIAKGFDAGISGIIFSDDSQQLQAAVISNTGDAGVGSSGINNMVNISQSEYDALSLDAETISQIKLVGNTLYFVV